MFYQPTIQPAVPASPRGVGLDRFRHLLRAAALRLSHSLAVRRGRHELQRLTDRELADIGLHRGAIHSAVHGRTR